MLKLSFTITIAAVIFLLFGVNPVFGQCGADGTQPCPTTTTKKTTTKKIIPKKVTKPTVTKPKTTTKPQTTVTRTTTKPTCSPSDNNDAPSNSTQTINGVKFEMVGIPSGSFCMGSTNGSDAERPVHKVTISEAFFMSRTEVTQAQWKAVIGNNPSYFKGDNLPVEKVSWEDAQEFIKKLNAKGEGTYRLPSEAE